MRGEDKIITTTTNRISSSIPQGVTIFSELPLLVSEQYEKYKNKVSLVNMSNINFILFKFVHYFN